MVAEPLGTKSIAAGIAESQLLSSELWDNHPCCVVSMRDDFIEPYSDAVYEFTRLLVDAGRFIEQKPETAAEIAVRFLDPEGKLGLKVPLLKNVLTEERGIRTADLYPEIEDFEYMQKYMVEEMGIGSPINLSDFIVTKFADAACTDRDRYHLPSQLHDSANGIREILERSDHGSGAAHKTMPEPGGQVPHLPPGRSGLRHRHPQDQGDHRNDAHPVHAPVPALYSGRGEPSGRGDPGHGPQGPLRDGGKGVLREDLHHHP